MSVERQEWRVTGQPGHGYPPYSFVFGGPNEANQDGAPEDRARAFIALTRHAAGWVEGPFLERRTIIESDWEPAGVSGE